MRLGILEFLCLMGGIEQAAAPVGGVGFPPEIPLGLQPCKLPRRRALMYLPGLTYICLSDAGMGECSVYVILC